MNATTRSIALAGLCLAAALSAQSQNVIHHDDNNPATGAANAFPFGSEGTRIQQLIPNSVLGTSPAVLQDLFVAPAQTVRAPWTESEVVYADFEIRMGTTTATTLSRTWANNISNPVTVYRGPLRVRFERDQWTPLGLPNPYVWVPASPNENLVVDLIFWQVADYGSVAPDVNGYFMWMHSGSSRSIQRAFLRRWTTSQPPTAQAVDGNGIKLGFLLDDGNFVAHGGGCTGTSGRAPEIGTPAGTWPQIGSTMTVELTDGPVNSVAFLNMGFDTRSAGPLALPFDLAPFGAPGCTIWHDLIATFPSTRTGPSGGAALPLPIPNDPTLMAARVYASWLCVDPGANGASMTTSGYATIILGT